MNIVNKDNFEKILNDNEKVMLTFSTTWCGPCKMLTATLENISVDGVYVAKIDAEENTDLAVHFGIRSVPSTFFFKNGKSIDSMKFLGAKPKDEILKKIEEFKND